MDAQRSVVPEVVFHGTPNAFEVFEPRRSLPLAEIGFWFASSSAVAWMVAVRKGDIGQCRVIAARLDLRNPLVLAEPGVDGLLALVRAVSPRGEITRQAVEDFKRGLVARRHDGMILHDVRADGGCTDNFVVFEAAQITVLSVSTHLDH